MEPGHGGARVRARVVWLVLLAAAAGVAAALWGVRQRPDTGDRVRAWLLEYDSLQQSLEPLRDRAFLDPEVAAARLALVDTVAARLRASHPQADSLLRRAREIEAEMDSAPNMAGLDPARYAGLLREYRAIYAVLEPAERDVLAAPEVRRQFDEFRALLDAKMYANAGPDERRALDRIREIERAIEQLPPGVLDSVAPLPDEDA